MENSLKMASEYINKPKKKKKSEPKGLENFYDEQGEEIIDEDSVNN